MWAIITRPGTEGGKWEREAFFETGVREMRRVNRYLSERGFTLGGKHALDFGCGIGRLTQAMAAYFEVVSGVDISASMLEKAREENPFGDRLRFYHNEVSDLRLFESDTFDFIYSNITLQHMEQKYSQEYIREFIRVLQPGGLLLFQLPAALALSREGGSIRRMINRMCRRWHPLFKWPRKSFNYIRRILRSKPAMEMYGTPRTEVEALLKDSGARILDVTPNQNAGIKWESYYYLVTK